MIMVYFVVAGGFDNAPVTDAAKFPVLLPKNLRPHYYTVHPRCPCPPVHAGVSSTLTALRQRFWIPAGRYQVKKVVNKCVTCKKVSGFPFQAPVAPPLTSLRLQQSRPFAVTGVDFTGELYVKNARRESKVYICLFTCAATRAVRLEVINDLSVGTFLLAVRRFAGRQSLPDVIISNNAATYQSAAPGLKRSFSRQRSSRSSADKAYVRNSSRNGRRGTEGSGCGWLDSLKRH